MENIIKKVCRDFKTTELKKFRSQCNAFAVRQCNIPCSEEYIAKREKFLEQRFKNIFGVDSIPEEIELYGDPRGFVAYIKGDKINKGYSEKLRNAGVPMDWGYNFSLSELSKR